MKKMLTHQVHHKSHSSKEKREKLSKRTKNTKLEIFSHRHFAKKWVCEKFCSQVFWPPKAKKEERKNSLVILFFEVFFPFLTFHHPSLCFLSFFLSLRPRNQNSFFFSCAKTERERLREIERGVWKSVLRFFLFIRMYKGKKTLEIFL